MLHCALTQSSFVCLIRIFSLRHRENKLCICSVIKLVSFTGRRRWGRKSTFVRLQLTSTAFSLHSVLCGCSLFEMFYNIETNICSCHRWNMVHEPTTTVLRLTVKNEWCMMNFLWINNKLVLFRCLLIIIAHICIQQCSCRPVNYISSSDSTDIAFPSSSSPDLSVGSFKWWSSLNSVRSNKELSFIKHNSQHIFTLSTADVSAISFAAGSTTFFGGQPQCEYNWEYWREPTTHLMIEVNL